MFLGIVLIFFGIASLSFAVNSPFYLVVGIGLIICGIMNIRKRKIVENRKNVRVSSDSCYDCSDCTTYTGTGIPEGAYLEGGRYESFSGQGWTRDAFGNPTNYITGVSVERDSFGNYRFSDDDSYGSIYDSNEYGRYNMDYGD